MMQNRLQLNADKTETMLVGTKHKLSSNTTASIQLGNASVSLSTAVKYLGVIIDNTLSMHKFITQTCQSCYCQLQCISAIRKAISSLKNGKAAGIDNIPAEALKEGGSDIVDELHHLLNLIWTTGEVPAEWKKACL